MRLEIEVKDDRESFAIQKFAALLRQAEISNRDGEVTVKLRFHRGGIRHSSLTWEEPGFFCKSKQ